MSTFQRRDSVAVASVTSSQETTITAKTNTSTVATNGGGGGGKKRKNSVAEVAPQQHKVVIVEMPKRPKNSDSSAAASTTVIAAGNTSNVPRLSLIKNKTPLETTEVIKTAANSTAVGIVPRFPNTERCGVCFKYDTVNPIYWTKCHSCTMGVHKTCISSQKRQGPWICGPCTVCFECEQELVVEQEATCKTCYVSFHLDCLEDGQAPKKPGATDWLCPKCVSQQPKKKAPPPTANEKVVAASPKVVPAKKEAPPAAAGRAAPPAQPYDPMAVKKIPDASKWSAKDVYNYFVDRFPLEAKVLLDQEVDGVSLLLMRRTDIVTGLGFKLGPALRIYKQVIMLQTKDNDPTLTWY